jgi:hypothetical protein
VAKLVSNVQIAGVLYGPDGEQPDREVSKQITNPNAWEGGELPDFEDSHDYPEGDPSKDWTAKQLQSWAVAHTVDVGGAKSKGDLLKALGINES